MTVYIVLQPADGDWDHSPTLLGVFMSREAAERRRATYPHGYGPNGPKSRVIEVQADCALQATLA